MIRIILASLIILFFAVWPAGAQDTAVQILSAAIGNCTVNAALLAEENKKLKDRVAEFEKKSPQK